ncbi:MAG: SHOCT domain-containing protein [Chloroflexota bacterium]
MRASTPSLIRTLGVLLVAALVLPAAAWGDLAQEEQQGRRIAESVQSGARECANLSADEFELIGEYAMGRYLEDTAAHEAMNDHMVAVMGEGGERRMHIALGFRDSGCRGGPSGGWIGPMAGMMLGRGSGGRAYGPGMMGGEFDYGDGPGMMGDQWSRSGSEGDGFDGPSAAAMIGMMAVLIAAVALAVFWLTRRRGLSSDSPLETLKRRYAAGELSEEQYEESRRLLEGNR